MTAITREVHDVVNVAEVSVSDDYGVTLTQLEASYEYTPAEARALSKLLAETADAVETARRMDADAWAPVREALAGLTQYATPGAVRLAHGFDLAPLCRDCEEGKHAACIGSAFVERGEEIEEVECRCDAAGHPTIAGEVQP
jgi:hypothetical protein